MCPLGGERVFVPASLAWLGDPDLLRKFVVGESSACDFCDFFFFLSSLITIEIPCKEKIGTDFQDLICGFHFLR